MGAQKKQQDAEEITKQNDHNTNFVPDYSVAKLAAWGVAGFIVGCLVLFHQDIATPFKTESVFHEIVYNPRALAAASLTNAIDSINAVTKQKSNEAGQKDSLIKVNVALKVTEPAKSKSYDSLNAVLTMEKTALAAEIENNNAKVKQLGSYSRYYDNFSMADSSGFIALNKAIHFSVTPDTINQWEQRFDSMGYAFTTPVNYFFKEADGKMPERIGGTAIFAIHQTPADIDFFAKYPSAGVWVLLILIFCSLCFICVPTAFSQQTKVVRVFTEQGFAEPDKNRYLWISWYTALVIGVLYLIWYISFFDDPVVKSIFFMKGIMRSLYVVIFLGIAAGSFCIAGFIYTASMLSFFAKELKKKKNTLDKSFIGIPSPDVQPAVTGDQATSNTTQKEVDVQKLMFGKLTGIFQTYFMLAAMILSATVLCAGALFSTINSLDFIKLLTDDWGYSPARSDFVYFYGALFTIVLLFVYVPAKIKFAEVDVWSKDPTAATAPAGKWYDIVKNPFDSFKGVLVAASPLLASLLQSLLDLLFNKAG